MRNKLRILAVICSIVVFFIFTSEITDGMYSAILRCINIIIPSLFFMMVISDYLIKSDILTSINYIFRPIGKLLGMSNSLVPVFILSNIGGYPVGIKMISSLTDNKSITKKQAEVMAAFCFSSGPAFSVGAVGLCVFQSNKIGAAIFLSIITANIISAVILSRCYKLKEVDFCLSDADNRKNYSIINSIESASKSLFSMCSVIVIFSTVCTVAENVLANIIQSEWEWNKTIILSLLDITYLTRLEEKAYYLIPSVTFVVSIGGICVWLQNTRLCSTRIRLYKVFLIRLVVSVFSALIYITIFSSDCKQILAVSSQNTRLIVNIDNFTSSICLIIMIFLLFYKKRLAFQNKV